MLKRLDPWMWRFVIAVISGAGLSITAVMMQVDPLLQLGRVMMTIGGGAMYTCYVADRFFGTQGAKMLQGVFLACLLLLLLISSARLFGGSISQDLAVVQLIGYMGLSMLFPISIFGFSGLMASNYMRVRSGRIRGIRELIAAALVSLMMYSGFFHWSPEITALVCAALVVVVVATSESQ